MNEITITCAIIDDEPLAISMIEKFVERTPFLELKGAYSDSLEAIEALRKEAVNLVFLDIQMPDLDGMEFAKMLPSETRIIFTTAFKEYAFDSYEVHALDFLLKPVRYQKFMVAVEKAKEWFEMKSQAPRPSSSRSAFEESRKNGASIRVNDNGNSNSNQAPARPLGGVGGLFPPR